jgi:putative tryptophan/tyrosine transport system substrate-binding protein
VQHRARRSFLQSSLVLVGAGMLVGCGARSLAGARPTGPRRIGYLESLVNQITFEPFRDGLRDLGYVDGENIAIEYRAADGELERLPGLAAELVGLPVELIVAPNPVVARTVSGASSTIPVVAAGGNVVAAGLVTSIAHPEGNITGVTTNSVEAVGKWMELLKETVPTISRLAVVLDLSGPSAQAFLQQVQRAAQALQLQVAAYDVRDLDQLPAILSRVQDDRRDSLVVVSGGVVGGGGDVRIGTAARTSRLPAVAELRSFALAGGLLAHDANTATLARRSARFVDRILRGAKPGELPIELPTEFNVVLNLRAAQELGISVPESVVQRATEVIQ